MEENLTDENKQNDNKPVEIERLTHRQKLDICKMIATGMSTRLIAAEFFKIYGRKINHTAVYSYTYRKKWKRHIARYRAFHAKNVMKIPGAQKADRIKYILIGIEQCLACGGTRNLASLLRELRLEMEGETPLIDNSTHLHIDLKKKTDEEIIETVRQKGIGIPARVSAYFGTGSEQ